MVKDRAGLGEPDPRYMVKGSFYVLPYAERRQAKHWPLGLTVYMRQIWIPPFTWHRLKPKYLDWIKVKYRITDYPIRQTLLARDAYQRSSA